MIELNEHFLAQIFESVLQPDEDDCPSDESVTAISEQATALFSWLREEKKLPQGEALKEALWRTFLAGFMYRDALGFERNEEGFYARVFVTYADLDAGKFELRLSREGEE